VGGKRPASSKPSNTNPADRGFSATRHHHISIIKSNEPCCIANGMCAGRTGGDDRMVRPLQPVLDRYVAGSKIDKATCDEEGAHTARTFFMQRERGVGNAFKAADPRTDHRACAAFLFFGFWVPARIVKRLLGGRNGVDDKVVNTLRLLGV